MSRTLNAIEVLDIAEQIERNGAAFYRRAAELFNGNTVADTLLTLANWEEQHEKIFANMRTGMLEGCAFDLEADPLDVKAVASLASLDCEPNSNPAAWLTGSESRKDALNLALKMEHNAIVCFTALTAYIADEQSSKKMFEIIAEESSHVKIITQLLAEH